MKKIIYYIDNKDNFSKSPSFNEDVTVYKFSNIRDVVLFLIENINFHFVLCDESNNHQNNLDLMVTVFSITPFIEFVLFDKSDNKNSKDYSQLYDKIKWIHSIEDLEKIEINAIGCKRKYNRINWPLEAHFSKSPDMNITESGSLLSLSAGGAFIETNSYALTSPGENLYLMIEFRDFKLYVDSTVIRIHQNNNNDENKPGVAVEFHHVSKITQNCIDSIIKDRLASKLLFSVDEIFDTKPNN